MKKPAFWNTETLEQLFLSVLLSAGILPPLLLLFGLGGQLFSAGLWTLALLCLFVLGSSSKGWKWLVTVILGAAVLLQFFLPRMGFFGSCIEAFKALILYLNKVDVVMPLFGSEVALMLATCIASAAFLFSRKGVGFLPAAIILVLTLFALWALGRGDLIGYTAPALCALLLLISQASHEKISLLHVLPMAIVVVLLSLLLLPAQRVTVPPLEKAASDLKQTIMDYLFFREPRDVFSLSRYGYYPMDSALLGGPAEPTDYPVMIVQTPRKTLLRAVTKNEYTGRSFQNSINSARRYLYIDPTTRAFRNKVFSEKQPPEALRRASPLLQDQSLVFQVQNPATTTLLLPLYLREIHPQTNMVPYFNAIGELFITRNLETGDRYRIVAPIFEGGDAGLDALVNAALQTDPDYEDIFGQYTQIPAHLSNERTLFVNAANMVENAQTPYDKALAIQRHLHRYYRYTLTPKLPPENKDFVSYFLLEGKEGYCTYYAAAMTMLCRIAGLPARYVEGFMALPESDGLAYLTGLNAHAWTEVYFEGFGWIPFDPTPPQQDMSQQPPETPPEPDEPDPEPTPTPEPPDEQEMPTPEPPPPEQQPPEDEPTPEDNPENQPENDPDKPPFPWWILLILGGIGGLVFQMRRRRPQTLAEKTPTETEKIFLYGNAIFLILKLRKHLPKPGETPLHFARRMDTVHTFPVAILPLWRMMALSHYSRKQPDTSHTLKAQDIFQKIFHSLSPLMKLRFLFTIAFHPGCYRALDTVVIQEETVSKTRLPESGKKKKNRQKANKKRSKKASPSKNSKQSAVSAAPETPAKEASRSSKSSNTSIKTAPVPMGQASRRRRSERPKS